MVRVVYNAFIATRFFFSDRTVENQTVRRRISLNFTPYCQKMVGGILGIWHERVNHRGVGQYGERDRWP
jgi:hypothetical protein